MKLEVGAYGHIYNRGNRKQQIVHDAKDRWHFLQVLYYLNNRALMQNPFRELRALLKLNFNNQFVWPERLGERIPLVKILAFKLMDNHFHLLLRQEIEDGVRIFMQRAGIALAKRFNARYQEVGGLFQGTYKGKLVETDEYLSYVSVYIQVKNAFEEYPGGLERALDEFDKAYEWVAKDPYNSLGDYVGIRHSPIVDKDVLGRMFRTPQAYKDFTKQCMLRMRLDEKLGKLCLE
jgi:putative transposase